MRERTVQRMLSGEEIPTGKRYWLTPPELFKELDDEFHFNFDPCPHPLPLGFDGLKMEWGSSNYVNPPFNKAGGCSPILFVHKVIEENRKGKKVVLVLPVSHYIRVLVEAGAEIRSLGRIPWIEVDTGERWRHSPGCCAFILE